MTRPELEKLSAYLDGELSADDRQRLTRQMTREQRDHVNTIKWLSQQLQADANDQAVSSRVKQAVKIEQAKQRQRHGGYGLIPITLSLIVAIVFLYPRPATVSFTAEDLYSQYHDAFLIGDQP